MYISAEGLQPGDRLGREADLAEQFGVSRPTLREALRLLSSAHIVRAVKGPGGGIFVSATPDAGMARNVTETIAAMISTESIALEELLEARLLLEVPVAGMAAQRATPEDVCLLRSLVAELASCADDPERFGDCDIRLHQAVARVAGNRLVSAFTAWIGDLLLPGVRDGVAPALVEDVIVAQQRELVEAIARGDAEAARAAMREHLTYTLDLVNAVDLSSAGLSRPSETPRSR